MTGLLKNWSIYIFFVTPFRSDADSFTIRAGTSYKERDGVVANVAAVHQNPAYDSNSVDYDISVLELQTPLVFTLEIQAIKLPMVNQDVPGGLPAFVTGWGVISEGGFEPTVLQGVDINIVSREVCMEAYGNDITEQMICAGVPEGGKDSCNVSKNILWMPFKSINLCDL